MRLVEDFPKIAEDRSIKEELVNCYVGLKEQFL